jgi:hypothetical protein
MKNATYVASAFEYYFKKFPDNFDADKINLTKKTLSIKLFLYKHSMEFGVNIISQRNFITLGLPN